MLLYIKKEAVICGIHCNGLFYLLKCDFFNVMIAFTLFLSICLRGE
jgi:hypothetical protein